MSTRILQIFLVAACVTMHSKTVGQDWQLVWQDEFTDRIGPDWVFETGNGTDGWGNRELEYYRAENATVQNGRLVITAKRENFGGFNYTSVRMKTQGRKSWKYGKVEARISMPAFQGAWPAFWMLGDSIGPVPWPACGEIDIMEHVNTGSDIVGTIHWQDHTGKHASYGGSVNTSVTAYHVYGIEWDGSSIKWFIDGVQYHEANVANGVNGTSELHNSFFVLLNLAIGGNWPGFTVDNSAFPANMYVDYVRVYQRGSTPPPTGTIEAERYTSMSGVQTEITADSGGGLNVGYIDTGDWVAYANVNFPTSGAYTIEYRVASPAGGRLSADLNAGSIVLGVRDIPATGGWQNWTTVSQTVNVNAGTYNLGLYAVAGGWNINWIRITPTFQSTTIQAEGYSSMSGVQTETTTDTGGGANVSYIDVGDWMAYASVNFPVSGSYTIEYRVASASGGGRLSADLNAGSIVLGVRDIPATGGWQNWTTVSHTVTVAAGTYNFGIYATVGGWNLNWIRITPQVSSAVAHHAMDVTDGAPVEKALSIFPNPVLGSEMNLLSGEDLTGGYIKILDRSGNLVLHLPASDRIDVSSLPSGFYTLLFFKNSRVVSSKHFVK